MIHERKKINTLRRYVAIYFAVLFAVSGGILLATLKYSAGRILDQETTNTTNTMKRAADILENQYEELENIAVNICSNNDYRLNDMNNTAVHDIELLKGFKQYVNFSPLARQYFLVYSYLNKIFTSTGNTSYFNYYAPVNIGISYDLTNGALRRITECREPYFERSGSNILAVFPLRIFNEKDERTASLCFILNDNMLMDYLNRMTVGLPERFTVFLNGEMLFCRGEEILRDAPAGKQGPFFTESTKGKIGIVSAVQFSELQLLFSRNTWLILVTLAFLIAVLLLSVLLAKLTLRPLDQLIRKYEPESTRADDQFRQLDSILANLDAQNSSARYQLKNHLLNLLLRGEYSDRLMERWSMLGVSFGLENCCVLILEGDMQAPDIPPAVEALSGEQLKLYCLLEQLEGNQLIVLANYAAGSTPEEIRQRILDAEAENIKVFAGCGVDSPKKLPISFMAALNARQYGATVGPDRLDQVDALAVRLLTSASSGQKEELEAACREIPELLAGEPVNGIYTRHRIFELISSLLRQAEERNIHLPKAELHSLMLLTDAGVIADDLNAILRNSVAERESGRSASDETAKLIVDYVIAYACDPDINLQDMSQRFGLSADYISSIIKRETGSAFKEYVTMLRISEARRLLKEEPGLTVNDVALRAGYRKTSNFSKKFKELTGMLPSQMR